MPHWALQYLGQKWTKEQDCLYWYRVWKKEQFGREVAICDIDHDNLIRSASREMAGDIYKKFGYHKTENPVEGDAAFLTQRNRPHHIGMVISSGEELCILHCLEGNGVIVSSLENLTLNGWAVKEYWTDES